MGNNLSNGRNTKILLAGGVLLLSAVSASWSLSEGSLNNHECYVSITAREMLASGDWIWPTCNGMPRLQKTPLPYWLVAGLAKITGRVDEFTTRLPSVVFGVLSAAIILYFVNQWLSFRIALLSASVWATSLAYIRHSHNARPEMVMTFFIVLCFASFYSAIITRNRRRQVVYMLVFWVSFGLGMLAKGPAPLPLVLIPLFFYVAIFRQWRVLPKLLPITGVIIFLTITLPWPLLIANKLNWNLVVWKHNFVDRFFGTYSSGNKPIYYYLYIMFQFILPWVAFLPMALAAPFYQVWNKKQRVMQFLWLWFIVGLAFLTICGGKRQHYILPIMPAMAVLIGILLEDMIFTRKAYTSQYAAVVLRNHIIVIIAGAVAMPIYIARTHSELLAGAIIVAAAAIIIAAATAILFAQRRAALGCAAAFVGIVVLVMISYSVLANPTDYNRHSREFSRKVAEIIPQSEKLVAYKSISKRAVYYFGSVIPVITDESALYRHYEDGDWVIATGGSLEKLSQDDRFRRVWYKEKAERLGSGDTDGALFHKSAAVIKDDT